MSTHLEAMNAAASRNRSTPASAKGRTQFVREIASRSVFRTQYCVSDLVRLIAVR
jgi:hypothetical protein